jgi:PqqD family protein of HPr-rel-A system
MLCSSGKLTTTSQLHALDNTLNKPDTRIVFSTPEGIRWKEFEDQYIVFNPLSDEVHRLNSMAAMVLAELEATPQTLKQVIDRIGFLLDVEANNELYTQVHGIVAQFDELGLVFPIQAATDRA